MEVGVWHFLELHHREVNQIAWHAKNKWKSKLNAVHRIIWQRGDIPVPDKSQPPTSVIATTN